jgi:hypothetical protein
MKKIEEAHHKAFVQFLNTSMGQLPQLAYVKHTRNESFGGPKVTRADRKRPGKLVEIPLDVIKAAQLGVRAGVWDFEYIGANRATVNGYRPNTYSGLAIEFKAPGGTLTDEQKEWQRHYQSNNWRTEVFRHWVDAARYTILWMGGDLSRFLFT